MVYNGTTSCHQPFFIHTHKDHAIWPLHSHYTATIQLWWCLDHVHHSNDGELSGWTLLHHSYLSRLYSISKRWHFLSRYLTAGTFILESRHIVEVQGRISGDATEHLSRTIICKQNIYKQKVVKRYQILALRVPINFDKKYNSWSQIWTCTSIVSGVLMPFGHGDKGI